MIGAWLDYESKEMTTAVSFLFFKSIGTLLCLPVLFNYDNIFYCELIVYK